VQIRQISVIRGLFGAGNAIETSAKRRCYKPASVQVKRSAFKAGFALMESDVETMHLLAE